MTKRRRRNKKWVSRLFILVLLIAAGAVCYFVWDSYFRDKTLEPEQPVVVETKKTEIKEQKKEEKKEETEPVVEKEKVPQYDGEDPNESGQITGVITYAGMSGNNLMIRMNIDQYLNGGTCKLALSKDGAVYYTASAPVIDSAASSTCEGFNVPAGQVADGKTDIVIFVSSSDKSGEIMGEVSL